MRIIICMFLVTVFIATLSSCNGTENNGASHIIKDSSLDVTTPSSLRAIDRTQLVLEMSIDGEISRYNGSEYPDDVWPIELVLQNDTTHTIDLKWFAREHLLVHEYGEFFADSTNSRIELDLEFADEGTGKFDDDCDGISNLEELKLDTDAGLAGSGVCPADDSLEGAASVYLVRNFLSFEDSGYDDVVRSMEQSIKVRAADLSRNMRFASQMLNDEPFDTATDVTMSLSYSEDLQKYAYFEINKDTISAVQELTGTCGQIRTTGRYCRLPFNWQTDQWYTFRLELDSANVWQASVFDHLAEQTSSIGKIEVAPELEWHKPRISMRYDAMAENFTDCNASLPRIAMQTRSANANGVANARKSTMTVSRCVDGGVGWRAGTKTQDDISTYSLSIGDGR